MTARVVVRLKDGVLDPQGETIRQALKKLGNDNLEGVRQGKYFEIEFQPGVAVEKIRSAVETIAREVLTNPIVEEFEIEEIQ